MAVGVFCTLAVGGPPGSSVAGGRAAGRSLAEKLTAGPGVTNHPIDVRPSGSMRLPEGWPLSADGTLTCLTCHTKVPTLEGATRPNLRDFAEEEAEPLEFCRKCHLNDSERSAAAQHWLAVGKAHPRNDAPAARSSGLLDGESRMCLGCHDGVNAVESSESTALNRGAGAVGDPGRNHPVGVRYPTRAPRNQSVPFRPQSLLPAEIRLPDGKVSCVSCHDLYARDQHHLTLPIEGSMLCFSCHELN